MPFWISPRIDDTWVVACLAWSASVFISSATTAKLRPSSPAVAASMAALSARSCERSAMSLTEAMMSPMAWVFSLSATMCSATDSVCSSMASMTWAMSSIALRPSLLRSAALAAWPAISRARVVICWPDWLISSSVAVVSWMAANCCSTLAACCLVEASVSVAAELRLATASRVWTVISLRLATIWLSCTPRPPTSSRPRPLICWVRSPRPMRPTNSTSA